MVKIITIKKSAMYYTSILVFLLCAATTCKKDKDCPIGSHASISLVNNSSRTLNWRHFTPDSIYRINGSTPAADMIIQPYSSDKYGTRACWEETFKDGYSAYFLIFNNDTVQAIGWQTISGSNRGLLKRLKVDLFYLQNNNFTITYP